MVCFFACDGECVIKIGGAIKKFGEDSVNHLGKVVNISCYLGQNLENSVCGIGAKLPKCLKIYIHLCRKF